MGERALQREDFPTAIVRGSSEPVATVVVRTRAGHAIEVISSDGVSPSWLAALVRELERGP